MLIAEFGGSLVFFRFWGIFLFIWGYFQTLLVHLVDCGVRRLPRFLKLGFRVFLGIWDIFRPCWLTSLIAEFGGSLGLFLGFSFMTLWDGMARLEKMADQARKIFPGYF